MPKTVSPIRLLTQTGRILIGLIAGTLTAPACSKASAPYLTVKDFLGPDVGKTYVYYGDEGLRVEVVAEDWLSPASVRVRETSTLETVGGEPISSTTSYDILAEGGELIRESGTRRHILLKEPISHRASPWSISFEVGGQKRDERRALAATCHVMSVEESVVVSTKVETVTVECVSESEALSVVEGQEATDQRFVVTRRFAKAIGLVSEHVALRIDSESIGMTSKVLEKIVDTELIEQQGSEGARP